MGEALGEGTLAVDTIIPASTPEERILSHTTRRPEASFLRFHAGPGCSPPVIGEHSIIGIKQLTVRLLVSLS